MGSGPQFQTEFEKRRNVSCSTQGQPLFDALPLAPDLLGMQRQLSYNRIARLPSGAAEQAWGMRLGLHQPVPCNVVAWLFQIPSGVHARP